MKMILMAAVIAMLSTSPAMAQKKVAGAPVGKPETLRVSAISLDEDDTTLLTLRDSAGVKLEPTKVPLTICKRDRLGRVLPGMDVKMIVENKTVAGKRVRFVRPERFRPWCN